MRANDDALGAGAGGGGGGGEVGESGEAGPPVLSSARDARSIEELVEHGRRLGPDPAFGHLDDAEIEDRLRTGAAALAAATCRWLEVLGEYVIRGGWAQDGARSPVHWMSAMLSIAPSTAREHVRVAVRLRECVATRDRFAAGTLSYSKVRAITRVATPEVEALLLDWADDATAAELDRIVADTKRCEQIAVAPALRDDLGLTRRWRDDGTYELVLRCDGATGLEVDQRLDRLFELSTGDAAAAEAAPAEAPAGRDVDVAAPAGAVDADEVQAAAGVGDVSRRPRKVVLADALVGALSMAVAASPDDTSGADRHLAVVEMSASTYAAATQTHPTSGAIAPAGAVGRAAFVGVGRGRGRTRPIPLRQLGRLACSSRLDLVVHDDGHPADLGTSRRYPDAMLRRLVLARDRCCRFPGCGAVRFLHAHHVLAWEDDGPTDLDNLVLLCGHHHRFIHTNAWELRAAGRGRWTFHAPGQLEARRPAEPLPGASAGALALLAHADRRDPRSLTPQLRDGFGYDHEMAVEVLLDRLATAV